MIGYTDRGKTKIGMSRPTALANLVNNEEIKKLAQDSETVSLAVLITEYKT